MSLSHSLTGDTPLKQNASATGVFINGNLEEQRTAVMTDLRSIPEVTVDFMLNHIVPYSGIDVERTRHVLIRKGDLLDVGWKEFSDALPKNSVGNEQKVFSKMATIYQNIIASTRFDGVSRSSTLDMGTCPDIAPISEKNVKTRPDGCGQLVRNHPDHTSQCRSTSQGKGDYHWFNIAYVEEYKKKHTIKDLNDNVLKILWSLHHMMKVDHRRRFAFGVTIENTNTRIWFCCRQIVFVTRPFDFMKEPAKLIKLVSSLAYANVVQLGYDPNMKLLWKDDINKEDKDKWYYRITIKGKDNHGNIVTKVYKTTETIAMPSTNLRGRATRVYEAYDVESPGTKVVIKDSWVDANRPQEADVLAEILDGASEEEKALFLTVLLHGVVMIDDREDLTQDLLLNGYLVTTSDDSPINEPIKQEMKQYDPVMDEIMKLIVNVDIGGEDAAPGDRVHKASIFELFKVSKSTSQAESQSTALVISPDVSTPSLDNRKKRQPLVYGPKTHYRIVFKERGESLHRMSLHHDIKVLPAIQYMQDILKALAFLTKKGYVHRDISPGNIVIYNEHAKLTDLEFAKVYGTNASNNVRTGTYGFMAVEVENGAYMFHPREVFSHNPLHDLESLWWVGVWLVSCHYKLYDKDKLLNPNLEKHIKIVATIGEKLFGAERLYRRHALTLPKELARSRPQYFSTAVNRLFLVLLQFRECIFSYYESYKPKDPQDRSFFTPDVHSTFDVFLEDAIRPLKNAKDETELWPMDHILGRIIELQKNEQ